MEVAPVQCSWRRKARLTPRLASQLPRESPSDQAGSSGQQDLEGRIGEMVHRCRDQWRCRLTRMRGRWNRAVVAFALLFKPQPLAISGIYNPTRTCFRYVHAGSNIFAPKLQTENFGSVLLNQRQVSLNALVYRHSEEGLATIDEPLNDE